MGTTRGPSSFAALLRQYRAAAGLAQEELAERAGLSRRGISDLERGARRAPYPATVRRLAEALGLDTAEQARLRAAARGKSAAREPTQSVVRAQLPFPLTSLVGREQAVADAQDLLASARLVTLTGSGGIGKTRLAIEVARQYPESVFVDLAPLADGRLVASTLAVALDLDERPGVGWLDVIAANLISRRALVVLDNCEHVVEACAEMSERLLRACPGIRILATSREPLGVAGEQLSRVPPLPTVDPASSHANVAAAAIRLFVERARLVQPAFVLDNESTWRVKEICQRLDGVPLAIELAAARLPLLGLEGLRLRLNQRLEVLKSTARGVPTRHQTLGAAIEWSYDQLSPPEQKFFRDLSAFMGSWTYEAAAAVCAEGLLRSDSALDLVEQLVNKSLVHTVPVISGSVRYRVLETVRQFARQRLDACGGARVVLRRHAEHYLRVAEQAALDFGEFKPPRAIALLELEYDNLRAALEFCVEHRDAALGLPLGAALGPFWALRGYLSEGREWLMRILALPGAEPRTPIRARALSEAGFLALRQADFSYARNAFEESLSIRRECGDMDGIATCLNELGLVADDEGNYAYAITLHEESLAIRRDLGDPLRIASSLNNLGGAIAHRAMVDSLRDEVTIQQNQEDGARARRLLEEALVIRREHEDLQWIAGSLMNLAFVADFQNDYGTARSALNEGLLTSHELGDRESVGWALEGLAMVAAAQGDAARALRLAGAAESVRATLGTPLPYADLAVRHVRLPRAREMLGNEAAAAASAQGRAWSLEDAISYAVAN